MNRPDHIGPDGAGRDDLTHEPGSGTGGTDPAPEPLEGQVIPFPRSAEEPPAVGRIVEQAPPGARVLDAGPALPTRRADVPLDAVYRRPLLTAVLNRDVRYVWDHIVWRTRVVLRMAPYLLVDAVAAVASPVRAYRGARRFVRVVRDWHSGRVYDELAEEAETPKDRFQVIQARDARLAERTLFWLSPPGRILISVLLLSTAGIYWWARFATLPAAFAQLGELTLGCVYAACALAGKARGAVTAAQMARDTTIDTAAIVQACADARLGEVRVVGAIARERGLVDMTTAVVELPPGGVAVKAVRRVDEMASGLNVDRSQVFMEPLRGVHAGRFTIKVADENPFGPGIPSPRPPLLSVERTDMWEPVPVAFDPLGRTRTVDMGGDFAGLLLGGSPGAGKSAAAVNLEGAIALDPFAHLWLADGKGVDSRPLWPIAHSVTTGDRDGLGAQLEALHVEMNRRLEIMPDLDRGDGRTGVKKITREVAAANPDAGLYLLFLWIDELAFYTSGKGAKDAIEEPMRDLVARCRAAGIRLLAATQKPDGGTVPTSIRDLISGRWALRCETPEQSDTVLGRGKSSQGFDASAIEAGSAAAGVGYLKDEKGQPIWCRSFYYSDDDFDAIADRAYALRKQAGTLPVRDWPPALLTGMLAAIGDAPTVHTSDLLQRLANAGHEFADGQALADALRPYGIRPQSVRVGDAVRNGYRADHIRAAIDAGPNRPAVTG